MLFIRIRNKIAFVLLIIFSLYSPVFAYRYAGAPQKNCFSNQRLLLGAIEMYNMDHNEMIHEINEDVIELLKKEKYLKGDRYLCPSKREPGHYLNQGDLCENGVIFCDYHGSAASYGNERGQIVPPSREYQMDQRRKQFNENLYTYFPIIISIAFVALIIVLFSGNKKKR